ncbi:MAG TPA: LON peptidase substrate-binding domain-containing protein [Dehalococcoidia bacterium]|nr:LON peptidase substrate-binding domain-containing protein [Dehalococcoidia bacterium]
MDLRLFPLNSVLFPGMRMPLHIFEERYKLMVRECIEEDAPFGVVLIRAGDEVGGSAIPHAVGTTARIVQVEYLDEGKMNLFAIGDQRFRIIAVTTTAPYLRAEVELLEPRRDAEPVPRALIAQAHEIFDEYLRMYMALGGQWMRGVQLPEDIAEAADYIAARMDIPAPSKQELLEQLSPEARLARALEMITEELPEMRVRLDAYLRQKTSGFGTLN